MRRVLSHRHAPTVATALAAAAYLVWAPRTADMAAHAYRAWLFSHDGLTVWNAQWYGGHHVLGYSLLFAPLGVWPGPAWTGALACVAAAALFAPLAGRAAPAWLFALAVLPNLVIGRMPFALGIALGVAAWAAGERRSARWRVLCALAALGCVLASPVAGAFLALATTARLLARGRGELPRAAALGLPVLAGGIALTGLFPEGGPDRFVATAFWPMLAVSAAALALLAPGRRAWWLGGALAIAVLVAAFAVPNTFGQNALRLPVLLGPVALALAARPAAAAGRRARRAGTRARAARFVVGAALLYLGWLPAVRAVSEAHGDPSTRAEFWSGPRAFLARAARPGERVEVAFTHNHWEVAYLAPTVPLARGWERQVDAEVNPLFYADRPLTAKRYHRWLRADAVRWVLLPSVPLDYSARAEAALLRRGAPFLRPVARGHGWRLFAVRDAARQ
jgi:hypothetical protein